MSTNVDDQALSRGVLDSVEDGRIVLRLPGTDYRVTLRVDDTDRALLPPKGKRVRGTITARALRMHPAAGGGRYIEPADGEPRIVSGTVLAIDVEAERVLVNVAVPMWLHAGSEQDFSVLSVGSLVNCYVESGATFRPAS
ncbi:MAG: hypothetical protein GY715_13690 [Planctomycetes bacterium]|nr:hypothetical protein [Planctomycetota bacterium]